MSTRNSTLSARSKSILDSIDLQKHPSVVGLNAEAACTAYDPPVRPLDAQIFRHAVSGEEAQEYLEENVMPLLSHALHALCVVRPPNPVDYLALYLLRANPNVPEDRRGYVEVSTNPADIAPVPQEE
eukprot:Tbor_TRINITY_DN1151_c0_g1::TRINITY_DN1151_c0_g1_i1::g.15639::m.15639